MSSGSAAACMCAENGALIKALRVQIAAPRREMVGMAAEPEDDRRELGEVRAELAAHRDGAVAKYEEARCKIASLQAWAELAVGGTIAPGACVNDIMSVQPLAVEMSPAAAPPRAAGSQRWPSRYAAYISLCSSPSGPRPGNSPGPMPAVLSRI